MIVVDASAILEVLLRTPAAQAIEERLFERGETLHAPHLVDLEVLQVLRRYAAAGEISAERAREALDDLAAFRLRRWAHDALALRIWELAAKPHRLRRRLHRPGRGPRRAASDARQTACFGAGDSGARRGGVRRPALKGGRSAALLLLSRTSATSAVADSLRGRSHRNPGASWPRSRLLGRRQG